MSIAIVSSPAVVHDYLLPAERPKMLLPQLREHAVSTRALAGTTTKLPQARPPSLHKRSMTCTNQRRLPQVCQVPAPLRLDAWSSTPAANFQVRSATYLSSGQKEASQDAVLQLLTCDLVQVSEKNLAGMCAHPDERVQQALQRERQTGVQELPDFVFCVNLCVPGPSDAFYHFCAYFGCNDRSVLQNTSMPLGRVAQPFFWGNDDEYRHDTFKLIPRIVSGNFVVRTAVGSKPSILGRKVQQHYRTDHDRYFEVVVDISSDTVAQRIVKLALGYAKTLEVDMMFVLQGHNESMLPERILGGVRVKNVDFKNKDGQRMCAPPS